VLLGRKAVKGKILLTQAQLDHAVDALTVRVRVLQGEAARQQTRLKQQHHQVLDRLVVLVLVDALAQLADDRVVRVDLQVFLGRHVAHGGRVAQRLRLHDPLHVGRPAVL